MNMTKHAKNAFAVFCLVYLLGLLMIHAQLNIPSDGSDGVFAPTEDVVVDLSQASDGIWSDDNTANAGNGIYDKEKWAVVFKYQSVSIPEGVGVTFKNHRSRAPIVWLVQGNVEINGVVSLDGFWGGVGNPQATTPLEPGPGGFRGGAAGDAGTGGGFGPGGGAPGSVISDGGNRNYGNPQNIPLLGGSGGGAADRHFISGGAGGGAILVASSLNIVLNGAIHARGGRGTRIFAPARVSGGGSGGAVRLVGETVLGNGGISAVGLTATDAKNGSNGRIRIEANSMSPDLTTAPSTIAVAPGDTPIIWPPDNAPNVKIVSVDSVSAPEDPSSNLLTSSDIGIQTDEEVEVILETTNFPIEGVVNLRVGRKFSTAYNRNAAYVSGDFNKATWRAVTGFSAGFSVLQARATAP